MQGLALLLGLAASLCFYLAAPNQMLVRIPPGHDRLPASRALCWTAAALTLVSAWLWSGAYNWPVAVAATLLVIPCGLSLWPFVGSYAQVRKQRRIAGGQA